jgi:hypothetical protein
MAKKEEIYPDGFPRQTDSFSETQKFKFDVYEAIKEIALKTTEKAFEDKGYSKKEGRAGEYGTGENYGAGTELNHFNIRLSSRPNTNTYFEKIIYFGGKETISDISLGWDAKNKVVELAYKTSEFGAFRGYKSKTSYAGAQLINDRTNFVVSSLPAFKKELEKIFKAYAEKEVAHITSTKIGIEDKTEKSINSMVENMKKNKLTLSGLFASSFEDASNSVDNYISEAKKEKEEKKSDKKSQDKEKLRMNNPEVVAANSKSKLLFDELTEIEEGPYKDYFSNRMKKFGAKSPKELKPSEWAEINLGWKSEEEKLDEIATAGSAGVGAIGGETAGGTVGTAGNFKYAANPFKMGTGIMKRSLADTNYAKSNKKRSTVKKNFKEGDSFYSTVELNPGSGYVPKGMEHNYVMGQHGANVNENVEKKIEDPKILKESLVKRKFTTMNENEEKGVNKRYIVTEQRSEDEQKERWKKLSLFETYETINKKDAIHECDCGCGCQDSSSDEDYVTMDQGQEENEQDFMQRNQEIESGESIDGKEVIMVSKPNSLSNAMYKVFKSDYMNESRAYILDMTSGNLVNNPNFKPEKGLTGPTFKTKK